MPMDENDRLIAGKLPDLPHEGLVASRPRDLDELERADAEAAAIRRVRASIADLPPGPDTWRWLGSIASRYEAEDAIRRTAASADDRSAFDEGAMAERKRRTVSRPAINETIARRVTRAIEALARPSAPLRKKRTALEEAQDRAATIRIDELVRRTPGEGRGGRLDVTLDVGGRRARLFDLDGPTLASYSRLTLRAVEEGLMLPDLGRHAKTLWTKLLGPALHDAKCEPTVEGEDLLGAIVEEIVDYLHEKRSEEIDAVLHGRVVELEGRLVVRPKSLISNVRSALAEDAVARQDVARAARSLGMAPQRVRVSRKRLHVWTFPAEPRGRHADEGRAA